MFHLRTAFVRIRRLPAPLVVALGLLLPPAGLAFEERAPSDELAELRALEDRVVETIDAAKKAFVFLEGGSGFVISADGYILTNDHVIGRRTETVVQICGGKSYRVRLVGRDPQGDVALLRAEGATDLPFLELGDSGRLRVGQHILAIGDPFLVASLNLFFGRVPPDQEPSASLGIVSALHRYSDTYSDAIQVDSAVNRGNSGGPLLTLDGKVVGINGKIETRFAIGINSGVGYAVPSDQIRNFLESLKSAGGGTVEHGVISGLYVADRAEGPSGLAVSRVDEGSSAAQAGFQRGDRILEIEGLPVPTRNRYKGILSTYPAGTELDIKVSRGDEALEITVPLEVTGNAYIGIEMEEGPDGGVLVKRVVPGGPAEEAGLQEGDVLLLFQGRRVGSMDELKSIVRDRAPGDKVQVGVLRDEKLVGLELQLGSTKTRRTSTS